MKKLSRLTLFVLAAGVAFAATQERTFAASRTMARHHGAHRASVKTEKVEGEFVSYDAATKTLTMKTATGDTTAPVKGRALARVKSFKAGDKVVVTYRDKADGTREAAIAIAKAPARKS